MCEGAVPRLDGQTGGKTGKKNEVSEYYKGARCCLGNNVGGRASERAGKIWNKGGMEEEGSEAGTNDGCAQGHTSTAVSPPNSSNVR